MTRRDEQGNQEQSGYSDHSTGIKTPNLSFPPCLLSSHSLWFQLSSRSKNFPEVSPSKEFLCSPLVVERTKRGVSGTWLSDLPLMFCPRSNIFTEITETKNTIQQPSHISYFVRYNFQSKHLNASFLKFHKKPSKVKRLVFRFAFQRHAQNVKNEVKVKKKNALLECL